jgi:hypothetical protein
MSDTVHKNALVQEDQSANTYRTRQIHHAGYLVAKGAEYLGSSLDEQQRVWFHFKNSPAIPNHIRNFMLSELEYISPKTLYDSLAFINHELKRVRGGGVK